MSGRLYTLEEVVVKFMADAKIASNTESALSWLKINRSVGNRLFFSVWRGPKDQRSTRATELGCLGNYQVVQSWEHVCLYGWSLVEQFFKVPLACDLILWKFTLLAREQQETWELQSARQLLCRLGTPCHCSHGFTHKISPSGTGHPADSRCVCVWIRLGEQTHHKFKIFYF